MTKLTTTQIQHLAKLANIPLTPEETETLSDSISKFLEHVEKLKSLDLSHTPTTNQVTNSTNQFRQDSVTPSLTQTQALANAHRSHNGYFVVDAVISHD